MIYNHRVIHNGKLYLAGENVPVEQETVKVSAEPKAETKPPVEEPPKEVKKTVRRKSK